MSSYYCEECHRVEDDDILLDTETCGLCGGFLGTGDEDVACRQCGCTDSRACMTSSGPCYWVEPDLCSACAAAGSTP